MSKIYSVFLYSDPTEYELLVAKVSTEQNYVESWIVVESNHSFKGRKKEFTLTQQISTDKRLSSHRARIYIIENRENFLEIIAVPFKSKVMHALESKSRHLLNQNYKFYERKHREKKFFEVERMTRDLAIDLLLEVSKGQGWAFICDVDEILTIPKHDSGHWQEILSRGEKFLRLRRFRYVFDFDNLDGQFRTCPLVDISLLRNKENFKISEFRERQDGIIYEKFLKIVEFSYCLSLEGVQIKLRDFSHEAPPNSEIEKALLLNHSLRYPDDPKTNVNWLTKVPIVTETHPDYVVEFQEKLMTGVINKNYLDERKLAYPELFGK